MTVVELPGTGITMHEVLGGSETDLADLLELHHELFPEYAYYQPYMRERARSSPDARSNLVEHWWLIRVKGQAAGVRFFDYVPQRDCGLGLAVGIRPEYRKITVGAYQRLSEVLLLKTLEYLTVDASKAGRPVPIGMVSEIEDYILSRCIEYGYVELPVSYQEPSRIFSSQGSPTRLETEPLTFRPLALGCLPSNRETFDPADAVMLTNVVKAFLVDHYGLPEDHKAVCRALGSIESKRMS